MNVREEGEQKRHEERTAIDIRNIELREEDLKLNERRDWRERWLFLVSIASFLVSLISLWIAGTALRISCLQ